MKKNKTKPKKIVVALPSLITLFNLSLGFLSLLASIHGHFLIAGWLIVLAAVIDGIDGIIARLTKSNSDFGVELDSLADSISFATATSILLTLWAADELGRAGAMLGFIFLSAGILRLARYNIIQGGQKNRSTYIGLTVPSASVFIVALIFVISQSPSHLTHKILLFLAIPLISFFMVSRIRYPNFLSRSYWGQLNLRHFLLIAAVLSGFYLHPPLALLILASINVSSGPLREAWRLSQKIFLSEQDKNEVASE